LTAASDSARQRALPGILRDGDTSMYEAWFSRPVPVATGISGEIKNLSNANQAVDLLTKHWRSAGSQKHLAALRACRQAVNGGIAADVARDAFVDAAREAHILVE
jgi:hypothetical protein